ncbi:MAG: hypothetical protein QOC99_2692 [Acidobacteriota bacterium]|nr:hypothetical protein [Acidobacteriota bacterium]
MPLSASLRVLRASAVKHPFLYTQVKIAIERGAVSYRGDKKTRRHDVLSYLRVFKLLVAKRQSAPRRFYSTSVSLSACSVSPSTVPSTETFKPFFVFVVCIS